jgi:peptide deformylase
MTQRAIRKYPDPCLRRVSEEIKEITDEVRELAGDMIETMHDANGVGLAANQVGICVRLIVIETGAHEKEQKPIVLVNPKIVAVEDEDVCEEGCLSVPGFYEAVKRADKAVVEAIDLEGQEMLIEASGVLARACQHEIDHLNGILFIDHLSPVKKSLFKKDYQKENK